MSKAKHLDESEVAHGNTRERIAILGPCVTEPLRPHLRISSDNIESVIPPGMGGYNITHLVLARLANSLPTDLITCDPSAPETLFFEGPLLRLWIIPRRTRHLLRDIYRRECELLLEAIAASDALCLHANWAAEYALAASRAGRPWILSLHDNPVALARWIGTSQVVAAALALRLLRKAPVVTGVSPYVCEFARKWGRRNALCVTNPIYPPLLKSDDPQPAPEVNEKRVVAVINWSRFKNARRGLLAFKHLHTVMPSARLLLIGPGLEPGGPAEKWAASHGLSRGVEFIGNLPYRDCLNYIRQASVLFHPALEEAMGCQIAEAMLLETPVVCAKQARGPAWLIEQGQYGRLADGLKPKEMVTALTDILATKLSDLTSQIRDAREHIEDIVNAGKILELYNQSYQKAIRIFS